MLSMISKRPPPLPSLNREQVAIVLTPKDGSQKPVQYPVVEIKDGGIALGMYSADEFMCAYSSLQIPARNDPLTCPPKTPFSNDMMVASRTSSKKSINRNKNLSIRNLVYKIP